MPTVTPDTRQQSSYVEDPFVIFFEGVASLEVAQEFVEEQERARWRSLARVVAAAEKNRNS